jgi:hypothetical protein
MAEAPSSAQPSSPDTGDQQVSLEGGAEPRVVGQLASVGGALRLVYPLLRCLSDHCLLYDLTFKALELKDFWDWFIAKYKQVKILG